MIDFQLLIIFAFLLDAFIAAPAPFSFHAIDVDYFDFSPSDDFSSGRGVVSSSSSPAASIDWFSFLRRWLIDYYFAVGLAFFD